MSANSKIEWCHHTFNPWWGCAKVSPGCDNCYAERDAARFDERTLWGVDAARREFGDKHWNEPLKWDRKARALGIRYRVFCASMADVFDKNAPAGARLRLFELIGKTTNLDWLILTKRIGNASRMLEEVMEELSHGLTTWAELPWPHVWLGSSITDRDEMLRDGPKLKATPAAITFWSYEPALAPLGEIPLELMPSWVICGGESGPNARPMNPRWAREVRDQCEAAGVPFLFKQWGEWEPIGDNPDDLQRRAQEAGKTIRAYAFGDGQALVWSGKKNAGRLLDGVEHNGYPEENP